MKKTAITINSRGRLNALMSNPNRIRDLQSLRINAMIKCLPLNLFKLSNLNKLSISSHKLRILPAEIGLLINLKELNLSGCQLKTLPQEIGNLTSLEKLNLSNNKLVMLPPKIEQLPKLEIIDLRNNLIPNSKIMQLEWLIPTAEIKRDSF